MILCPIFTLSQFIAMLVKLNNVSLMNCNQKRVCCLSIVRLIWMPGFSTNLVMRLSSEKDVCTFCKCNLYRNVSNFCYLTNEV